MTATVHLRWVDELPPPGLSVPRLNRIPPGFDHRLVADTLRFRPGAWAMLPDLPANYTPSINGGANMAYRPGGSFEAVARQGVLYARFVG